jgi:hypothetical protein
VHDGGPLRGPRPAEGLAELGDRADPQDVGAEALGVGGQVDRQVVAVQQSGLRVAEPVAGAEPLRSEALRQGADRGEPVVLHQDDHQLDPLGHRRDDLAVHHQIRAVADQRDHLAVGGGHLDPECAGDLVAHAGVPVLDVVLLGVPRPPQHLEVPGEAAGGLHEHVAGVAELVHRPDHLGLGRQRRVVGVEGLVDDPRPPPRRLPVGGCVAVGDPVPRQCG